MAHTRSFARTDGPPKWEKETLVLGVQRKGKEAGAISLHSLWQANLTGVFASDSLFLEKPRGRFRFLEKGGDVFLWECMGVQALRNTSDEVFDLHTDAVPKPHTGLWGAGLSRKSPSIPFWRTRHV